MADKLSFRTPKGVAVYPRLKTPDTKFDDNGQYKADLRLPEAVAAAFVEKYRGVYKDWTGKALPKKPERDNRNAFYYYETDEDGEETGNVVLKLRVKNKITKKGDLWDRRPAQFDAKGKPIAGAKNVGGGTVMLVAGEVYLWETPSGGKGMSLQPEAVQLIDLKEFSGQKSAGEFGFGQEDGYTDDGDDDDHGFGDESDDGDYVPSDEGEDEDY